MEGLEPAYVLPDGLEEACRNQSNYYDDNIDELSKQVTWNKDANGYRLPTEAEWEYCARGGESHLYSGSNNIDEVAWHDGNSDGETHPVGQKKANGFGLYDMSGNVWEWIWDSKRIRFTTTDPTYIDASSPGASSGVDAGATLRGSRVFPPRRAMPPPLNNQGFRFLRTLGGPFEVTWVLFSSWYSFNTRTSRTGCGDTEGSFCGNLFVEIKVKHVDDFLCTYSQNNTFR